MKILNITLDECPSRKWVANGKTIEDLLNEGGITEQSMEGYMAAGANTFGLGSALFKPEYDMDELEKRAVEIVNVYGRYRSQ